MARIIVVVLGLVATVGASMKAVAHQGKQPTYPSAQAALRYFESVQGTDFDTLLRHLRRPHRRPQSEPGSSRIFRRREY